MSTPTGNDGGELSISRLLSTLVVVLHPDTYVFTTVPSSSFNTPHFPISLPEILLFFREPNTSSSQSSASSSTSSPETQHSDQVTLILRETVATQHKLASTYRCKMITCNVHSSLEAVGFMAVLATKLADRGVSVNPVSGYFHDHLFVPVEVAQMAVEVLERVRKDTEGGRLSG